MPATRKVNTNPKDEFRDAVLNGLSQVRKAIPSRFFYDDAGSDLFEKITELPEYYLTRAEIALLQECSAELGQRLPPDAAVIEFGSGSSRKTELLLNALRRPSRYIPIDISGAALAPAAARIAARFPSLTVTPVEADFADVSALDLPVTGPDPVAFFPGSTIGNMAFDEAVAFLGDVRRKLGPGCRFVLGADLIKPLSILLPAYNDAAGVTAAFNLNLLTRINRELDGTFDLRQFRHEARFAEDPPRMEMHLVAQEPHTVRVAGRAFSFVKGETIHTENSHKYRKSQLDELARLSGWQVVKRWVADGDMFSITLMAA